MNMAETNETTAQDQRRADRFDVALPVRLAGGAGLTHNISAHGVSFESAVRPAVGSLVNFSVEFTLHGRPQRLRCEGKVLRVERRGDRYLVAARLVAPLFDGEEVPSP
jgi:acyl-coenzyme A thioesterase PaaI-like protein